MALGVWLEAKRGGTPIITIIIATTVATATTTTLTIIIAITIGETTTTTGHSPSAWN